MNLPRTLRIALSLSVSLLAALAALAWLLAWHPPAREAVAAQCRATAAELPAGQPLKVMTWNLQYLAGKRYVFWNDLPDASGPDERPTAADLANGLDEVVRVIRDENPDVLLLQGSTTAPPPPTGRTSRPCSPRAGRPLPMQRRDFPDWKVRFDPNPHVLGSGRKLVTFSRYRIASAERLALPHPAGAAVASLRPATGPAQRAPGGPRRPGAERAEHLAEPLRRAQRHRTTAGQRATRPPARLAGRAGALAARRRLRPAAAGAVPLPARADARGLPAQQRTQPAGRATR
jgi:hypothetical protein